MAHHRSRLLQGWDSRIDRHPRQSQEDVEVKEVLFEETILVYRLLEAGPGEVDDFFIQRIRRYLHRETGCAAEHEVEGYVELCRFQWDLLPQCSRAKVEEYVELRRFQ